MLMQSGYDEVHLLPALPDVWPTGSITGLRTGGGFEIVELQWKNSSVVKVVIKSTLGGNLRLRVPNEMKENGGVVIAKGKNANEFFQTDEIPAPVISKQANITPLHLRKTFLYDLPTQKGKTYTLKSN
jgi:alpha-L-fucosidase 2